MYIYVDITLSKNKKKAKKNQLLDVLQLNSGLNSLRDLIKKKMEEPGIKYGTQSKCVPKDLQLCS